MKARGALQLIASEESVKALCVAMETSDPEFQTAILDSLGARFESLVDCLEVFSDEMRATVEEPELRQEVFVRGFLKENAWHDPVLEQPEFKRILTLSRSWPARCYNMLSNTVKSAAWEVCTDFPGFREQLVVH